MLNTLDVVLVILMVVGAFGGWRTSGALRLGRLSGLLVGAVLGLAVAGAVIPAAATPGVRFVLGLVLLLLGAALLGSLGGTVGLAVARGLSNLRLGVADRALGAGVSALLTLLVCWVMLGIAVAFWPGGGLAVQAESSALVAWVDGALPAFLFGNA